MRYDHGDPIHTELFSELVQLTGDEGARRLMARYPSQGIEVDDPGVLVDVDTVDDLAAVRAVCLALVEGAGAALRLARFNTTLEVMDKRYFQGLPSPAAAALVMGLIWVVDDAGVKNASRIDWAAWSAFGVTLYAGLSMVTNAPFYSFKVFGGRRTVPFVVLVAIMLVIAVVALDPPRVLFVLFCAYGVSGYLVYAWRKFKGTPVSVIATSTDEPDEIGLHR